MVKKIKKKTISYVIPCFNEEENVKPMYEALFNLHKDKLKKYNYEIIFIDNDSKDDTRNIIRTICKKDKCVKAIFNAKNFGQFNSPYYGMLQATGDSVVNIACDFQEPVDLIVDFVKAWEDGYKIAVGIRENANEGFIIRILKDIYYHLAEKYSSVHQIKKFTGFGLYDRDFMDICKSIDDPTPFFRGIVAEFGYKIKEIKFMQDKRRAGKSKNNFYTLFDAAMLSFTSYTKVGLRLATFVGSFAVVISIVIAIIYLVMKLLYWDRFEAGMIPLLLGMLFLGSVQIFFIGVIGEYVLAINQRTMKKPIVVEEERINF